MTHLLLFFSYDSGLSGLQRLVPLDDQCILPTKTILGTIIEAKLPENELTRISLYQEVLHESAQNPHA